MLKIKYEFYKMNINNEKLSKNNLNNNLFNLTTLLYLKFKQ